MDVHFSLIIFDFSVSIKILVGFTFFYEASSVFFLNDIVILCCKKKKSSEKRQTVFCCLHRSYLSSISFANDVIKIKA